MVSANPMRGFRWVGNKFKTMYQYRHAKQQAQTVKTGELYVSADSTLIREGPDQWLERIDPNGRTPLMLALTLARLDMISL